MSHTPLFITLCLVSLVGSCWTVDFTLITETGLLRLYSDNTKASEPITSSTYNEEYFDVSQALCNLGVDRCYRTISKIIYVPMDDSYVVLHGGMLYHYDTHRRRASCLRCTRLPLILDVAYNTKRDLLFWLQSTHHSGYIHMHAFPYVNGTLKEKERLSLLNIPSKTIDRPKLMYYTKTDSALILTVEQNEMYAFGTYAFDKLHQTVNLNSPTTPATATLADLDNEGEDILLLEPTLRAPLTLFRNRRVRSLRNINMSNYFNISTLSLRKSCKDTETGLAVSCMNFDSCVISSLDEWMGKIVVNFMCELLPGFSVLYDPYTFISPNAFLLTWGTEMEAKTLRFNSNTMLLLPRYNTSHMDIWRLQSRSPNKSFMEAVSSAAINLPTHSDLIDVILHKQTVTPIASYIHQTPVLRRYGSKKLIELIRTSSRYVLNFHRPLKHEDVNKMQILTEEELDHLLELEQQPPTTSTTQTAHILSQIDIVYINSLRYGLPVFLITFSLAFLALTVYYVYKTIKLHRLVVKRQQRIDYHDEEMQHLSLPRVKQPYSPTSISLPSSIITVHPEYKK